jgi:hypothetical protein
MELFDVDQRFLRAIGLNRRGVSRQLAPAPSKLRWNIESSYDRFTP